MICHMSKTLKQTSIRLPELYLQRADDLAEIMREVDSYAVFGSLRRADVLRIAIQRGLDVLEGELLSESDDSSEGSS